MDGEAGLIVVVAFVPHKTYGIVSADGNCSTTGGGAAAECKSPFQGCSLIDTYRRTVPAVTITISTIDSNGALCSDTLCLCIAVEIGARILGLDSDMCASAGIAVQRNLEGLPDIQCATVLYGGNRSPGREIVSSIQLMAAQSVPTLSRLRLVGSGQLGR